MRFKSIKPSTNIISLGMILLLLGVVTASAQVTVNLRASRQSATLPDGSVVPMWGLSCVNPNALSTSVPGGGTCGTLAGTRQIGGTVWQPPLITVPYTGPGTSLTINLANNLPAPVPTSLVIVGQVGGGLGTTPTLTPSPTHASQSLTWPVAGGAGDPQNTPPPQGPRVQSFGAEAGNGQTKALSWTSLRPGTYLIESGTHPSIQGPMGLYGVLVVTQAPSVGSAGTAYPGVSYNAEVAVLFSEIDPVQNNAVQTAVTKPGFSEAATIPVNTTTVNNIASCIDPTTNASVPACYPPAVNYRPRYYLINGVAFDKTHASTSLFPTSPATNVSGTVLVRMVNAGLRMHIPSIVGSQTGTSAVPGLGLIAEDGNPLPGLTRVQNEVFMAAGKTYDVMINVPAAGGTALPIFDREGSLSGNATARDAGMLAYISVNGAGLPNV